MISVSINKILQMTSVGERERFTQNRIIKLFQNQLGYIYAGNRKTVLITAILKNPGCALT